VKALTSRASGRAFMGSCLALISAAINAGTSLPGIFSILMNAVPVADKIEDVELSETTQAGITNNLKILRGAIDAMWYFVTHARTTLFDTTLYMKSGQLNPDVKAEFLEAGGTLKDLANHIAAFYSDAPQGVLGVTMSAVLDNRAIVNAQLQEQKQKLATQVAHGKTRITRNAFVNTCQKFVRTMHTESGWQTPLDDTLISGYIAHHADNVVNKQPIEDALYSLIIKVYFSNSFVRVIYTRLSSEFIKQIGQREDIDQNLIKLIEASTITGMIAEFATESGIVTL
jgi:hypothetical protein